MQSEIYLDNNTTTRPSERVVAKMLPFLTDRWGTPSAPHQRGQQLMPAIEESLRGIYALLVANESDSIIFTSSAAEGINQVVLSTYFDYTIHTGRNHFLTAANDEAPSIMSIGRLEQLSCIGKLVTPDESGRITAELLSQEITPRTALISLSWANGLTGVINPITEIAELCKERGIRLHVDASHVIGKIPFDWEEVPAHFITLNGDAIHAPSGTGALFIRHDVKCSPLILGGIEQGGFRAGSFSIASLAALGQAAREAIDSRDLMCTEVARLKSKLEMGILKAVPHATVFFQDVERVPNVTCIGFPGVSNEALLYLLNRKKVYASIGGGSNQQIGLVLAASNIKESLAHSAISFSLSRETTEDEIDRAIDIVTECVDSLRKLSLQYQLK